jgi:shikimate dehydrogenase
MATEIQRLGVVGHPIAHSKSPLLHKAAYEVLGLPWEYEAFDVEMAQFESFLATAATSLRGLSVTMPHKINALEAATELDLVAERTHSVNTLLFGSSENNPTISGFNTDVAGIVSSSAHRESISCHPIDI